MTDVSARVMSTVIDALQRAFSRAQPTPPLGGGVEDARLLRGDSDPYALWLPECNGGSDLLWARVDKWWYTGSYEVNSRFDGLLGSSGNKSCPTFTVMEMQIGIVRCVYSEAEVDFDKIEDDALISYDDSRRLRAAACWAMNKLERCGDVVQFLLSETNIIGPEGGALMVSHSFNAVIRL